MARIVLGSSPTGHVQNIAALLLNKASGGTVTIAKIAKASEAQPAAVRKQLGPSWRRRARAGVVMAVPEFRSKAPFDLIALHLSTHQSALTHADRMVLRCEKRAETLSTYAESFQGVAEALVNA